MGYSWEKTVSKPEAIRRVKPAVLDLFASTDRTTFSLEDVRAPTLAYKHPTDSKYNSWRLLSAGVVYNGDYAYLLPSLRNKLLAKIKDQNVNLAMMVAEYRKSADMFLDLSRTLLQGWRDLKRLRLRKLLNDREVSKRYIEFQFGLIPLASDLQGICDSLGNGLKNGLTLRASVSSRDEVFYTATQDDGYGGEDYLAQLDRYSVRLKSQYTIRDSDLALLRQFGLTNYLALGWELTPWSFMVDYMFSVGDWLSNLDALVGVSDFVYIQTASVQRSCQRTSRYGDTATLNSQTFSRSGPVTTLEAALPRYDPSSSLRKVLNGLALLRIIK